MDAKTVILLWYLEQYLVHFSVLESQYLVGGKISWFWGVNFYHQIIPLVEECAN